MTQAGKYWAKRADAVYLRAVRGICDTIAGDAKTVLDVGSFGTPILEWRRRSALRLVSIDLRQPYVAEGVESITADFLDYTPAEPFDLVTCLQVLEHVPDAATFARKLLAVGRIVVVSVPYKWRQEACASHIHDPVDEHVMRSWFGRRPTSQYVAQEPSGVLRLVQVYRTVAPPPPAKQPRTIASPERMAVRVAYGPRNPAASCPLFSIVRNEAALLPHFFRHYRSLGVDHFFIYDDQSTDQTPALLRGQPDCTVFTSPHRFGDLCGVTADGVPKRFCSVLRETLPTAIVPRGWAAVVDVDEFLILPPGIKTLPEMYRLLDDRRQYYATAPLVDFYPESFAASTAAPSATPFEACPYFDSGPLYEWDGAHLVPQRHFRGVRARLHHVMAATQPWVVDHIRGTGHREWLAKCWKVPLLKHGEGITRRGDHEISVPPATNCDVALAHFKFFTGFDRKVAAAVDDAQYHRQSVEYRLLAAAITMVGNRSLLGPESRRYTGPESLVAARLLQPVAEGHEAVQVRAEDVVPVQEAVSVRDAAPVPLTSVARPAAATSVGKSPSSARPTVGHSIAAADSLVAYWPVSGPVASNWGDKLNPYLIASLSGKAVHHVSQVAPSDDQDVLCVVGSMLGKKELINTVVWGAGFVAAGIRLKAAPNAVHAVRGHLTTRKLQAAGIVNYPVAVGDPALLMPLVYTPNPRAEWDVGIIPHFRDSKLPLVEQLRQQGPRIKVIDVFSGIEAFCDQIASCRRILSSSLHGLVAAHAYGVPARCIKLSDNPLGDGFKYRDYLSTIVGENTVFSGIQTIEDIRDLAREVPEPPLLPDLKRLLAVCPFLSHERRQELSEMAHALNARQRRANR